MDEELVFGEVGGFPSPNNGGFRSDPNVVFLADTGVDVVTTMEHLKKTRANQKADRRDQQPD